MRFAPNAGSHAGQPGTAPAIVASCARAAADGTPAPSSAQVIAFRRPTATPPPRGLERPAPQPKPSPGMDVAHCFNASDRLALAAWHAAGGNGYARLVLENGIPGAAPEFGAYALLYQPDDRWAAWGLTRDPAGILLWCCATGASHGTYPTMNAALAALPPPRMRA